MSNKNFNLKGFTMVELIIITVIISVLTMASVIAFSYKTWVTRLNTEVLELSYNIRKLQNYCMIGRTDKEGQVPKGFGIYFENTQKYFLFRDEDGNGVYNSGDSAMESHDLSKKILLINTNNAVSCTVPRGELCFDADNYEKDLECFSTTMIPLTIEGTGILKNVIIDNFSGKVNYEK